MHFESVAIANLRCLESVEFRPGAGTSLVLGDNGSGKTSLLEGLSLASLGKSFLSNRAQDIVRHGAAGLSVRALVVGAEGGRFAVTVRKAGGVTEIAMDGQPVMAASVLAQRVPTVIINSKAGDLLTESPSNRRALVDRTMFHVEPAYVEAWKRYRQALRQRNELLRRKAPAAEGRFWDEQLAGAATYIDARRCEVVDEVNGALADNPLAERLGTLTLAYAPGWNREQGLAEHLAANWERDIHLGHTSAGVHRADLGLRGEGKALARRLSRGQAKFIVCHVLMALAGFVSERAGVRPVLLVDDLAAELDDKMRARAVDMINRQGGQRVFTAIRQGELPEIADTTDTLFHVEQPAPASQA